LVTGTDAMKGEFDTSFGWMGALLHFADSVLPVGAYAHSMGLEGMCQEGVVHDEESLRQFLRRDVRHSLVEVDLPIMARSHAACLDGDGDAVRRWDELSWAMRPTRQLRDAAGKVGRQTWLLYEKTWGSGESAIKRGWFPKFQAPVVSGVVFAAEGAPLEVCLWAGAYQVYSALLQAALKVLPIGPGATQVLLRELLSEIEPNFPGVLKRRDEDLGTFNPLWDIGASRHERAEARMFIS
tara:strand:- start:323 stop:1039 length:717 start_codon:yes stop_codon:yes gene_type:complete